MSMSSEAENSPSLNEKASANIYLAYELLHYGYTSLLILCGVDKFFLILTDWTKYQSPSALQITHLSPHELLLACGLIEIFLGILAAFYPRAGSVFIGLWLLAITINLLMLPEDYYIALLNLVLAVGAFAMSSLCSGWANMQPVQDTHSVNKEEYHI